MSEPDHVSTTRDAYDLTAHLYVAAIGTEIREGIETELDRLMLAAFVEQFPAGALVADIGCGPGRVAALLATRHLDVLGVDISSAMLDIARSAHPGIRFEEGELTGLPVEDGTLQGAVYWYSIIHTPPANLTAVWEELARVLVPGGRALVSFQAGGGEAVHRTAVGDQPVALTNYRHDPDQVIGSLVEAGFTVDPPVVRPAELPHESAPQAFIRIVN